MTGLPPKISRGSANKHKNIGSSIVIKSFSPNTTDHSSIEKFLNSISAEEQLEILKCIIEEKNTLIDDRIIQFLAIVFFEAPAKHPVKCFLSRQVTKCTAIQKPFTNLLTAHIVSDIRDCYWCREIDYYLERVPKILLCIENFPCGARAVEDVGVDLLAQLVADYFFECRKYLRNSLLSSTKKNEIYNLDHVMLRLIVHVVQKLHGKESSHNHHIALRDLMYCVQILISDEEVPMDTKSLGGILILAVEMIDDAWKYLLQRCIKYSECTEASGNDDSNLVLKDRIGRLAVYSAIATTVSMDQLQVHMDSTKTPAFLVLLEQLLSYADGSASEPAVTVAVARAVLALARALPRVREAAEGARALPALLSFVWPHLQYHLDSVRHLAHHTLAACLHYCKDLDTRGVSSPLESLLESVRALGETRSFYWAVSRAVPALGAARVRAELCDAPAALRAAAAPHLQAAASAAISALLAGGAAAGLPPGEVFARWVRPALAAPAALHAALPAALAAHPALLHYIESEVRGRDALACARAAAACRAGLSPRAARAAAVHEDDETRILAVSLAAECSRTTAGVTRAELDSVLWFLRYNLNTPRPGLRTELLASITKLLKRLDDSHRALSRRGEPTDHYGPFLEQLRALCFAAALPGASHARRSAALQLLAATTTILPSLTWPWSGARVAALLALLDDGYDDNKARALLVLRHCPRGLLEECCSLTLSGVLRSAVSARAARGAAAAARLQLLLTCLPHRVQPRPRDTSLVQEEELRPHYALLRMLLQQATRVAADDMWTQAARGGAPGTLHCVAAVLRAARSADWSRPPWGALALELAARCVRACEDAEPVVAHHAPEGYLPAFPASAIELEEGQMVTAQMVLVCAWRTVKEASAVLGLLAALGNETRVCVENEQRRFSGQYLVGLLTRALHRGAVEQAAVGLAAVAHECWSREWSAAWPQQWARALLALVRGGAPHATRRGAGLPAAIQALVSSEVSATGRAECFNECMAELLKLASADAPADAPADALADAHSEASADAVARRTLAANILRALFRHTTLEKAAQAHVAAGLRVALRGFEAAAWPERTGMALLFCALCVRVFGVARARGPAPHARNTLPAHLFFARYPGTYDLMLSKLREFSPGSAAGPAVLPVLLLLARLHPAAAEGAASGLKLSCFVPLVQRCAGAAELRIRRLAACALPALLPPTQQLAYVEQLFVAISRPNLLHNHWHGALLTLTSLLERAPPAPATPPGARVSETMHALAQAAGPRPCYVIAKEYVNVLALLVWKFPEMVPAGTRRDIMQHLDGLLFGAGRRGAERALCLADCCLLHLVLLHEEKQIDRILPFVNRTLRHPCYEVVVCTLDYLLAQRGAAADPEPCPLRARLAGDDVLQRLRHTPDYRDTLAALGACLHDHAQYQECRLKSLRLLTLEDNTQMIILNEAVPSYFADNADSWTARRLMRLIAQNHADVKHMYLESLLMLSLRGEFDRMCYLEIYRAVYACSAADNSPAARLAAAAYLQAHFGRGPSLDEFHPQSQFEYQALETSSLATLLEDDEADVRARAADVLARAAAGPGDDDGGDEECVAACAEDGASAAALARAVRDCAPAGVLPAAAAELLRARAARTHGDPLLLLLALLDFRAEVQYTDEITEECKVFDQNERYNMFLEESVWTAACADWMARGAADDLTERALAIIRDPRYKHTFHSLCNDNVRLFEKMAKGESVADENVNPKIEILLRKLRGEFL